MDDDTQGRQAAQAERISIAVSRRKALALAAASLGSVGLASAFGGIARAEDLKGLPKKNYKFTFVNHSTVNEFFTPTIYGVQDACAFFGCEYQWTGSKSAVVSEMVNAMELAIAQRVDGIAVPLIDAKAFDAPVAKARAAGIPVVSYNADVPAGSPNERLAYVGQPLFQSGYNIASRWLRLVPKGGHVMISILSPGTLDLQPRLDGYIQAIKDAGNPVTYDVINTSTDPATQISRIESYYLAHKDVAGLFACGGADTYACGFVSAKYGLAKKGVIVAGYDLYPQTLGYIGTGDTTFTTDQQPYLQGFVPIQQLYLYKLSGGAIVPADTDTSLAFVTKDNLGLYTGKSRFEGSTADAPT